MSVNQIRPTLEEVAAERLRQVDKGGHQNHRDGTGGWRRLLGHGLQPTYETLARHAKNRVDSRGAAGISYWADILLEEVFEALEEEDPVALRAELIQVAAVAASWVEAIDRRTS